MNRKTILIISGWNRGLGLGILRGFARTRGQNLSVIAIARSEDPEASAELNRKTASFHPVSGDLSSTAHITPLLAELTEHFHSCYSALSKSEQESLEVILVNNAAALGPIHPIGSIPDTLEWSEHAQKTLVLNCIAPALLSDWLCKTLESLDTPSLNREGIILNISSGASKGPMSGAGVYSMSKAAVNLLSMTSSADFSAGSEKIQVLSISPGMVETDMQKTLRAQNDAQFPNAEYFRSASRNGDVKTATEIGNIIAEMDFTNYEPGSYVHVRDLS
jgi:NAD(P)-dependent dehydrogenase (short-subunit alcohol dehydrogenase family)